MRVLYEPEAEHVCSMPPALLGTILECDCGWVWLCIESQGIDASAADLRRVWWPFAYHSPDGWAIAGRIPELAPNLRAGTPSALEAP